MADLLEVQILRSAPNDTRAQESNVADSTERLRGHCATEKASTNFLPIRSIDEIA